MKIKNKSAYLPRRHGKKIQAETLACVAGAIAFWVNVLWAFVFAGFIICKAPENFSLFEYLFAKGGL